MSNINPTTIWLSEHILLSDMVGCDSVYRYGIPNPLTDADNAKIEEGVHLAETLEEYVKNRATSFTYGYISPGLSQAIVKYQNPKKRSYHRWDDGAACDMVIHNDESLSDEHFNGHTPWDMADFMGYNNYPLWELYRMHGEYGMRWSRAITYAESEVFCFATRRTEIKTGDYRMATYENRFTGDPKPDFNRIAPWTFENGTLEPAHDWRGRGWPHTHGGGRRQYEHVRTGRYSLLSDFLYDPICTHRGIPNKPPLGRRLTDRFMLNVFLASLAYERMLYEFGERLPIVGAYLNPGARRTKINRSYQDYFVMDLKPPRGAHPDELADLANENDAVRKIEVKNGMVRFYGEKLEEFDGEAIYLMAVERYRREREHFKQGSKL